MDIITAYELTKRLEKIDISRIGNVELTKIIRQHTKWNLETAYKCMMIIRTAYAMGQKSVTKE